jgi:hypothetical protein
MVDTNIVLEIKGFACVHYFSMQINAGINKVMSMLFKDSINMYRKLNIHYTPRFLDGWSD